MSSQTWGGLYLFGGGGAGGTPLKIPINMVFRDLANFKTQDVSMHMYIPTLVIRGFFLPMKSLWHSG